MKKLNKKTLCLVAAALTLTAGLSISSAMAYFTTYAEAKGGVQIHMGFTDTEIEETVESGQKEIQIKNTGDYDCYVRVKALTGDTYKDKIEYVEEDGSGKWTPGADGYYYYSDVVAAGEMTSQLNVKITWPAEEEATDFNVIIIQESTQVRYDENGEPYADWEANDAENISYTTYE